MHIILIEIYIMPYREFCPALICSYSASFFNRHILGPIKFFANLTKVETLQCIVVAWKSLSEVSLLQRVLLEMFCFIQIFCRYRILQSRYSRKKNNGFCAWNNQDTLTYLTPQECTVAVGLQLKLKPSSNTLV